MKIEIPLYDVKIKFYFSYNLNKTINEIKKKHKKKRLYKITDIDFDGIVIGEFIPKNKLIYCVIKKTKRGVDVDTLTHEIYHLTTKIMKYNNFKFNKTDEPFAMLNGKLNSTIMNKLIKNGEELYYSTDKEIKINKL